MSTSLPAPPFNWSRPSPPISVLARALPVRMSSRSVPMTPSIETKVSLPCRVNWDAVWDRSTVTLLAEYS
ncbi:hypothetical protein D9M70_543310 [compost metagenome]